MNFVHPPLPGIIPNQELIDQAPKEAIKSTEGNISLAVLRKATDQDDVQNNIPLFIIPKPSQPDTFRSISDGKEGG